MSERSFLTHVRQYANLAQRSRKSYAGAIKSVMVRRAREIDAEGADDEQFERWIDRLQKVVLREYGVFDPAFNIDADLEKELFLRQGDMLHPPISAGGAGSKN